MISWSITTDRDVIDGYQRSTPKGSAVTYLLGPSGEYIHTLHDRNEREVVIF